MLRRLTFLIALLAPTLAFGQGAVLQQGGALQGHLSMFLGNGYVADAGGPTANGLSPINPINGLLPLGAGFVNSGLGNCQFSAYAISNYSSFCTGFDGSGNALMSVSGIGQTPTLSISLNGTKYPFPGTGTGNVVAPISPTPGANNCVAWNGGTNVKDTLAPCAFLVATNTALAALPVTVGLQVIRSDYASSGAPPFAFVGNAQTCAAQGYANDGGRCTNSSGGSWVATTPKPGVAVDVREFGAKCDGTTDDSAAFQAHAATGWSIGIPGGGLTCLMNTPVAGSLTTGNVISLTANGQGLTGLAPYGSTLSTTVSANMVHVTATGNFVERIAFSMTGASDGCPILLDGAIFANVDHIQWTNTPGTICEINGTRNTEITHTRSQNTTGALVTTLNTGSGMNFTASISGSTMTVSAVPGGAQPIQVGGYLVTGAGSAIGYEIIADGHTPGSGFTGKGTTGTYGLSASATIGSASMTASFRAAFACANAKANVSPAWTINDTILGMGGNDAVAFFEDGYCQSTRIKVFAANGPLECAHTQNTFDTTSNPDFINAVDFECQTPGGWAGFDFQSGQALYLEANTFCNAATDNCVYMGSNVTDLEVGNARFNGAGLMLLDLAGTTAKIDHGYLNQAGNTVFIGTISGTVMTVTSVVQGTINVSASCAQTLHGKDANSFSIVSGTCITSNGTGSGGIGTYNINLSQTWPSTGGGTPKIHEGPTSGGCGQFNATPNASASCPAIGLEATASDITIGGMTITNNAGYGIEAVSGATQITLVGNHITNNMLGSWYNDGTQDCSGMVFAEDGPCEQESLVNSTTNVTLSAAQMINTIAVGGTIHLNATGATVAGVTYTTPSAATLLAALPGAGFAGQTWNFILENETPNNISLAGGASVTVNTPLMVASGAWKKFACVVNSGGTTITCNGQTNPNS